MHVFVTGASGFVGSAIVQDLITAGHQVTGLARNQSGRERVLASGAGVCMGDIENPSSYRQAVDECDAVIHTAFNHDFSRFRDNCESDRRVILALGEAIADGHRPVIVTSGIGVLRENRPVVESDVPPASEIVPRAASEEAARKIAASGIKTYIVRLPPSVHGSGDHGFIPLLIGIAREKGISAYIDEGMNRWPAVHRFDAASVYRLILEKQPERQVYHASAEDGIPFYQIAAAIGDGLQLPVVSKKGEAATEHFNWFTHFAGLDCPASSTLTGELLGWNPGRPGLIDDIRSGGYMQGL